MSEQTDKIFQFELCNQTDLENDSMKEIEIELDANKKIKVLLIKHNNVFYCTGSKCTHYGVPLVNGVLHNGRVRCFAHGACFDIKTGDIEDYPGVDCLPKFDVFVNSSGKVVLNTTVANIGALEQSKRLRKIENIENRKQSAKKLEKQLSGLNLIGQEISTDQKNKKLRKCLIVGSGAAGTLCVDTLRSYGFRSNITLITKENWNPYDRPKLSKALHLNINDISTRNSEYFAENEINFEKNQQVESIEFEKKQVLCKSGKIFDYDKLIIATGLNSVKQETKPGHELRGVFTLRNYDDAKNIFSYFETLNSELEKSNQAANESKRLNVVAVGGSFIAMETLCFFADKANSTSMSRHKPYERLFGTLVSTKLKKLHETKNIKFFIDEKFDIVEFKESKERPGCLGAIKLHDNSIWPVDICLLAVGSKPATEFLKNSPIKLSVNNYVYVDQHMRTNLSDVYAVGDIAFFPRSCLAGLEFSSPERNSKLDHVSIGHWGLASLTGKVAAEAIVHENESNFEKYSMKTVPFFWSVQYNKMIRFAGYNERYDIIIFHEDKTNQNEYKCAAFYFLGEKAVGVATIDWDPVCALFAEILNSGIEVKREHVTEDPMNIKKLISK